MNLLEFPPQVYTMISTTEYNPPKNQRRLTARRALKVIRPVAVRDDEMSEPNSRVKFSLEDIDLVQE